MTKGNNRKKKVYLGYGHKYKHIPVIYLAGKYLSKAGFKIGDEIEISIENNIILISNCENKINA